MLPEIESRFDKLESRRKAMVERVAALAPSAQVASPKPGEFSPVQVLMHMALAEKFDLDHLQKHPPQSFAGQKAKPTFIYPRAVQRMRDAKKMGTFPSMTPRPDVTFETATKEWEQARVSFRGYFEAVTDPNAPMINLFMFGRLSALDLLSLLEAHCQYHETRFPA